MAAVKRKVVSCGEPSELAIVPAGDDGDSLARWSASLA